MINCPNKLNCSLITTGTNPVTHVAEVAINKLFKSDYYLVYQVIVTGFILFFVLTLFILIIALK